ncbi:probably inactive leucine-rich repeat receptor-like protein kinase At5g48380 [Fagus crenata]
MAHSAKLVISLVYIFAWSFLDILEISNGSEDDINCLRSIKESLEDPYNRLKDSWNFSNPTEGLFCDFVGVKCSGPSWDSSSTISNLYLRNMGLKGQFPRGIQNCLWLTGLDLSGNELSGAIPSDISQLLSAVLKLDLSFNNFSGEIPKSIVNCTHLYLLRLDNNQLTGPIPPEIGQLRMLEIFSVANNLLSGPVPDFDSINTITPESYTNNSGLCGGPLDCCKQHRWAFEVSFKSGFVIGYVVFAFSYTVFFMHYFNLWVGSKKKMPTRRASRKNKGKEVDQVTQLPTKWVHQEESIKVSKLERMVTKMSLTELSEATANFSTSNVIGMGKIGMMYRGVHSNGWSLAIKRVHDSQSFETQFVSELLALGRLKHNNIVPLLGYCKERKEKLLVYKYISNGNLCDWIHAARGRNKRLEWPTRIKIAIGIARGLAWLHHECNFRLVHLNLSSSSILIDQNFEPKISNFGGAIISNYGGEIFKNPRSNNIFVGSEVWELGYVKKDVYDFGILLLELITGEEPNQINYYSISRNGSLIDWIAHLMTSSSNFYNVIDESLIGQGFDGEIFQFLQIARTCLKLFPSQRPTTLELYNTIRIFGERYGITSNSEILRQSEFDTASTSNEIVEAEITLAN